VPLVVAGDGRLRAEVERLAGPRTRFVGWADGDGLRDLYRRCRAVLMPNVEDFGIVPVEAQACGAPVIAVGAGGARDTVVPGATGNLMPPDADADEWAERLAGFDAAAFDPARIRKHAEGFSRPRFRSEMAEVVQKVLAGTARP
jgi:glycosyltransferase involved in cell wall biosynthesis